ncbi:hypothetical protein TEHOK1_07980 [Tetragenococcus halophilus]|nr:hypothetical protein TEHOK1_07980 [Tetragenococcus halophilus]GMQ73329.1 hypothetical protein TEHSL10_09630 [Tetragenococcus halophilus]
MNLLVFSALYVMFFVIILSLLLISKIKKNKVLFVMATVSSFVLLFIIAVLCIYFIFIATRNVYQ